MTRALAAYLAVALLIAGAVASDITLADVSVSLMEASGSIVASTSVTGPSTANLGTLDHTRTLKVSLTTSLSAAPGEDFRPQQVFLRLTCRSSQDAAYFAAVKAKDGTLYATAKSADIQKQVGLQSGAYTAAIIVGDTRAAQPLLWTLGEVQVLHAPLDDGSQPAAAPYRAIDRTHKPLLEIVHMHRLPERRAPAVVSVLFTLVAAAPVAIYVAVALQMGANLKGFPSGGGFLAAAGFHLGLLSILGLYLLFWLRLTMVQTLPMLAVLSAVTAAFGSTTLKQATGRGSKLE
ncbi:Dolichyl-diphosphooligosaccharide--protein glycosyltransferase subunit 2 [Chlorella vulgaris]